METKTLDLVEDESCSFSSTEEEEEDESQCDKDGPFKEEACVQRDQRPLAASFFYRMDREIYHFVQQEIIIQEAIDSYAASTWPAAAALCEYLERNRTELDLVDKAVLEIGSGTGLVSIVAALLGAWVTATDLPHALSNLRLNLSKNTRGKCRHTPQVAALSWSFDLEPSYPTSVYHYDYLLAADVVYHHEYLDELLATMKHFCQPGTTLLWANKVRMVNDVEFTEKFNKTFNTKLVFENGDMRIFMATHREDEEEGKPSCELQTDNGLEKVDSVEDWSEKEVTLRDENKGNELLEEEEDDEMEEKEKETGGENQSPVPDTKEHSTNQPSFTTLRDKMDKDDIVAEDDEDDKMTEEEEEQEEISDDNMNETHSPVPQSTETATNLSSFTTLTANTDSDEISDSDEKDEEDEEDDEDDEEEEVKQCGNHQSEEAADSKGDSQCLSSLAMEVRQTSNKDSEDIVGNTKNDDDDDEEEEEEEEKKKESGDEESNEEVAVSSTDSDNEDTAESQQTVKAFSWNAAVMPGFGKDTYHFVGTDVDIYECIDFDGCEDPYGAVMWPGAVALCSFLEHNQELVNLEDKSVLELGAGTGLVAIVASLLGAKVTATDLPNFLGNLRANVMRNTRGKTKHLPIISPLTWSFDVGRVYPSYQYRFDYVLAADVVYHHPYLNELLATMSHFCHPRTTIILANKMRIVTDMEFMEKFKTEFNTTLLAEEGDMKIFMGKFKM